MITAVSLNPSIDRTLTVEGFVAGGLNRVLARTDNAAGKGINVALTVSSLGLDAECVGFMYRDSAQLVRGLRPHEHQGVRPRRRRRDGAERIRPPRR